MFIWQGKLTDGQNENDSDKPGRPTYRHKNTHKHAHACTHTHRDTIITQTLSHTYEHTHTYTHTTLDQGRFWNHPRFHRAAVTSSAFLPLQKCHAWVKNFLTRSKYTHYPHTKTHAMPAHTQLHTKKKKYCQLEIDLSEGKLSRNYTARDLRLG